MPDSPSRIVINTSSTIALIAATGDLQVLDHLYDEVHVTKEVISEISAGGMNKFGISEFGKANFLIKHFNTQIIQPFLANSLDIGEASVIQFALDQDISTVCIDEAVGRRVARMNGLKLTGSIGILLRAKTEGLIENIKEPLLNMKKNGIWLSNKVVEFALHQAKETF